LQQKDLVPVEDDGQESPCNSWGEAIARTLWVVGIAPSMPLDTYESPAQACARSAQSDNLHGIDEATMQCIVKDPQYTVQTFLPVDRSFSRVRHSPHRVPLTPEALTGCSKCSEPASPPARPMVPHRSGGPSLTDGALVFR
jgi:hypothetical protein